MKRKQCDKKEWLFWKRVKKLFRILLGIPEKPIDLIEVLREQGMSIGNGVGIVGGFIYGSEPYFITIHDNVLISTNVTILTHDGAVHTVSALEKYKGKRFARFGRVEIGENSYLGHGVIVLPNVSIGKNCVIGAGAVVTRSIPDNSVAVGVPARVISTIEEYAQKVNEEMPDWWDWEAFSLNAIDYIKENVPQVDKGVVG